MKKVEDALIYIKALAEIEENEKHKGQLTELYQYLSNNKEGLIRYKERGLKIPTVGNDGALKDLKI